MKSTTRADIYRYTGKASGIGNFFKAMSLSGFTYIYFFRRASKYRLANPLGLFHRVCLRVCQIMYGFQIPPGTSIGEGFFIGHMGHIVISRGAKIGRNCNISPGTTIGRANRGKLKGYPTIGDYVWMGTNCVIVGSVKIGNNVLIAPGAYVNFDVPDNSIVLGNPGKIIPNEKATDGYISNVLNK